MADKVPSFMTGGTLWFTDLTTPDHSMGLPLLVALTLAEDGGQLLCILVSLIISLLSLADVLCMGFLMLSFAF